LFGCAKVSSQAHARPPPVWVSVQSHLLFLAVAVSACVRAVELAPLPRVAFDFHHRELTAKKQMHRPKQTSSRCGEAHSEQRTHAARFTSSCFNGGSSGLQPTSSTSTQLPGAACGEWHPPSGVTRLKCSCDVDERRCSFPEACLSQQRVTPPLPAVGWHGSVCCAMLL
jgi:hypothetical protein